MTIYTFNLLLGYESNGVDVAQVSRARMLRALRQPAKFVFTNWADPHYLDYFLSLGHRDEEILSAYLTFTDQKVTHPRLTVEALQQAFELTRLDIVEASDREVVYRFADSSQLIFKLDPHAGGRVRFVDYLFNGQLMKREWYGDRLLATEYYVSGEVVRRIFHHQDGSLAFETLKQGGQWLYRLESEIITSQTEMMRRFLAKLTFKKEDILLLDRASLLEFVRPIFELDAPAKLGFVFHSEHEFEDGSLNYEYYYIFKNAQRFDFFIVATEAQKKILTETLGKQGIPPIPIYVIPVGHLDQLNQPLVERKNFSIISASRLDPRKRLDFAIRAVALAHEKEPRLQFDIFGRGSQQDQLQALIHELGAQDYIHLRGYAKLEEVYPTYHVYLTTSQWETFGLTLMEAIGAGLAMVGFDARYGNPTFIKDGQNGYLVPYSKKMSDAQLISTMADRIVHVFQEDLEAFHQASYQLASEFLEAPILDRWKNFLKDIQEK
ncbi:Poly(glycerol-phosphate) alpha-glucosyltransferase GftA [Streptococcus sp. DD10]|uniref:glycosyltransferase n=1 Tax=Streptococcus sp. DD10 TaxID=1777878 RepID=UPI0007998431|nr:glycosyltransferase [Streptococcus sp. DD10]KXT74719.1 Poly(glycerol-phosphate) alpha-glucosyltransferase GftA [Streptococcus sp. DD10]